jgi:sulfur carrier protein ThiS
MNMKVNVMMFGQLKALDRGHTQMREVHENTTLEHLLEDIVGERGPALAEIIFDGGRRLHPSLIVILNDRPVNKEQPCMLQDGDRLMLIPAIAGG